MGLTLGSLFDGIAGFSDNARYMTLGNSIAVPCAERVFIGICKADKARRGGNGQERPGT